MGSLFTDRDWKAIMGGDNLTLVVPPTVISELDEKKYTAPNTRLQRRAQEVIVKFEEIQEGKPIPCGIQVDFPESPIEEVDWARYQLNPANGDDRIIAAILNLREKYPDDKLLVVTADLGFKLEIKRYDIKFVSPPDDWKRETKDPCDNEIANLRTELQRHKNVLPDVQLRLSKGDILASFLEIYKDGLLEGILTNENIAAKLEEERKELGLSLASLNRVDRSIREQEIARYRKDLEEYMSTYSQYLSDLKKVRESRLNIEILPCLTNKGSSPAEDIDISLEFPEEWLNLSDDIKLLKETDLPEFPIEPTRPTPPFSSISDIHRQLASHSSFLDLMPRIHSHGERGSPSQTGPKIG
jgi:hypothetical protein